MKLINCPICGARAASTEQTCPSCGFELQKYLQKHKGIQSYTNSSKADSRISPYSRHNITTKKLLALVALCFGLLIITAAGILSITVFSKKNTAEAIVDDMEIANAEDINDTGNVIDSEATAEAVATYSEAADTFIDSEIPNNEATFGKEDEPDSNDTPSLAEALRGVYHGENGSIFVFLEDGTAQYYYSDMSFAEPNLTWEYRDDAICVTLFKQHCTVQAKVSDYSFKKLLFASDSANWNDEEFRQIDIDPVQYQTRKITYTDPNIIMDDAGVLHYHGNRIDMQIPLSFRPQVELYETLGVASGFIDTDVNNSYVATITAVVDQALPADLRSDELLQSYLKELSNGYFMDSSVSHVEKSSISGKELYTSHLTGYLSGSFGGLSGLQIEGKIIYIPQITKDNSLIIMLQQTTGRAIDQTDAFEATIASIQWLP